MAAKTIRNIVHIDEEKCNGCGDCVLACAEGALEIVDGRARLIGDTYCDGLGACLGECPQGAITIEERQAGEYDEEAVKDRLRQARQDGDTIAGGCPSTVVTRFEGEMTPHRPPQEVEGGPSMLRQWPVQLTLVPATAPFLKGADLALVADCVPFAYAGFHKDFIKDNTVLVACPKLDNFKAHQEKLTGILAHSPVKSLTVVRMEVPCCAGLTHLARQAIQNAGKDISFSEVVIGIKGDRKT